MKSEGDELRIEAPLFWGSALQVEVAAMVNVPKIGLVRIPAKVSNVQVRFEDGNGEWAQHHCALINHSPCFERVDEGHCPNHYQAPGRDPSVRGRHFSFPERGERPFGF